MCDFKRGLYTRFAGRELTHQYQLSTPLSAEWIEEIRVDPEQFQNAGDP